MNEDDSMTETSVDRELTAYHEAGHAVAHSRLDIRQVYVPLVTGCYLPLFHSGTKIPPS